MQWNRKHICSPVCEAHLFKAFPQDKWWIHRGRGICFGQIRCFRWKKQLKTARFDRAPTVTSSSGHTALVGGLRGRGGLEIRQNAVRRFPICNLQNEVVGISIFAISMGLATMVGTSCTYCRCQYHQESVPTLWKIWLTVLCIESLAGLSSQIFWAAFKALPSYLSKRWLSR